MVFLQRELVGNTFGGIVALLMVLFGFLFKCSPLTIIVRATTGYCVAYLCGFTIATIIRNAIELRIAEEKAARHARLEAEEEEGLDES